MTQIEKAHAWFKANGYTSTKDWDDRNDKASLCVQVWNDTLEDSIDVYIDDSEIEFRAELWDEQINNTKLC